METDIKQMEKMLKTPVFKNSDSLDDSFEKFLLNIFLQTRKEAYRRKSFFSVVLPEPGNNANVVFTDKECLKFDFMGR